jgi:hypothetical protein
MLQQFDAPDAWLVGSLGVSGGRTLELNRRGLDFIRLVAFPTHQGLSRFSVGSLSHVSSPWLPGCLAFAPHEPTRRRQISGFPRPQLSWSFVMTIDKRGSCWSLFKLQTARLGWVVSGFESATSKVELILESRLYRLYDHHRSMVLQAIKYH